MSSYRYFAQGYGFPDLKAVGMGLTRSPLMAGIGLGDIQAKRTVTHTPIWRGYTRTGRVSGLVVAFKAISKTGLVNIPDMCRLKPYLCIHRGITGRRGLFRRWLKDL